MTPRPGVSSPEPARCSLAARLIAITAGCFRRRSALGREESLAAVVGRADGAHEVKSRSPFRRRA